MTAALAGVAAPSVPLPTPSAQRAPTPATERPPRTALKIGAVLGVVLPFCTFVFTEQQKARDAADAKATTERRLLDERVTADRENDLRNATFIQDAIDADLAARANGDHLCRQIGKKLILIESGQLGSASLKAVVTTFAEPETNALNRHKGCQCLSVGIPALRRTVDHFGALIRASLGQRTLAEMQWTLAQFGPNGPGGVPAWCPSPLGIDAAVASIGAGAGQTSTAGAAAGASTAGASSGKGATSSTAEGQATAERPSGAGAPPPATCPSYTGKLDMPTPAPRVYIQIGKEDDRPKAEAAQRALRAAGFAVPGIENVNARAPSKLQLRYFQGAPQIVAAASAVICESLKTPSDRAPLPLPVDISSLRSSARANHLELWFPAPPTAPIVDKTP